MSKWPLIVAISKTAGAPLSEAHPSAPSPAVSHKARKPRAQKPGFSRKPGFAFFPREAKERRSLKRRILRSFASPLLLYHFHPERKSSFTTAPSGQPPRYSVVILRAHSMPMSSIERVSVPGYDFGTAAADAADGDGRGSASRPPES